METDVIGTRYHHSHNADGTERQQHCCGCWTVKYDSVGLRFECNECGEVRPIGDEFAMPVPFAIRHLEEAKAAINP